MVKATFLGHSAVTLTDGKTTIIIDPFLTGNPVAKIGPDDVQADYIILTHAHNDHVGDTIAIAKRAGAKCIATNELGKWLQSKGVDTHLMGVGGSHNFPFGWVRYTIAHHSSGYGELEEGYGGAAAGVIISLGGKLIYHSGDTALTYDMRLIADRFKIDLAFFPIGSNFTMDVDDAVRAVDFVNPKMVVPVHYNTWPLIAADPNEFVSKVKGAKAVALKPMESVDVE